MTPRSMHGTTTSASTLNAVAAAPEIDPLAARRGAAAASGIASPLQMMAAALFWRALSDAHRTGGQP